MKSMIKRLVLATSLVATSVFASTVWTPQPEQVEQRNIQLPSGYRDLVYNVTDSTTQTIRTIFLPEPDLAQHGDKITVNYASGNQALGISSLYADLGFSFGLVNPTHTFIFNATRKLWEYQPANQIIPFATSNGMYSYAKLSGDLFSISLSANDTNIKELTLNTSHTKNTLLKISSDAPQDIKINTGNTLFDSTLTLKKG